jgi:hypothetical protein
MKLGREGVQFLTALALVAVSLGDSGPGHSNGSDANEVIAVGSVVAPISAACRQHAATIRAVGCLAVRAGIRLEKNLGADIAAGRFH